MSRNIFNLALDFYQSPTEHRDLLDPATRLPPDIGFLLDALTENKDPRSAQPKELPADLRAAIQFLVERVFFAPGADCYRILGLNIGAEVDEIRKHYNQLLNILALDQVDRAGEWNAAYAGQINRAYSVLRDPERRLAYDHNLLQPPGSTGGAVKDAKMPGDAEAARAPRKVSYLNPAAPSVRPAGPEQESREVPRPSISGGTGEASGKAVPGGGVASISEAPPRSSFIANRIDRAGGMEPVRTGASARTVGGEEDSWMLQPDPAIDSPGRFPRGIPVAAPEPQASRRIFSMDRASFALAAAVVLVLIVYAIVLPTHFEDESESEPEVDTAAAPPADLAANGNVIREGIEGSATAPAQGGELAGAGAEADAASSGMPAVSQADAPAPVRSPVEQGSAAVDGGQASGVAVKTAPAVAAHPERTTPGATPAVKQEAASPAGASARDGAAAAGSLSPSKKLEAMRQTPRTGSASVSVSPSAERAPRDVSAAATGSAKPAQEKTAAPGRQSRPQPATGDKEIVAGTATTGAAASIAPAQPAQNSGITIQELDRLGETFSRAYEAGDLPLLVSLFSDDARTNDQSNRAGIEKDYRELFDLSEMRRFTFGRLRWEQNKGGEGLQGEGDFQAEIRLKGETGVTTVHGKVVFGVKRASGGVVITEMLHSYN